MPAITFSRVDFPAPFGPTTPSSFPGSAVRLTCRTAGVERYEALTSDTCRVTALDS